MFWGGRILFTTQRGIEWFPEEPPHTAGDLWWPFVCVYVATLLNDDFNIFQLQRSFCEQECVLTREILGRVAILNFSAKLLFGRYHHKTPMFWVVKKEHGLLPIQP